MALSAVLALIVFLTALAGAFQASERGSAVAARGLVSTSRASLAVDAGLALARTRLETAATPSFRLEEQWVCRFAEHELEISIEDLAGRIDINNASPELLRELLEAVDVEPSEAASLAAAIADYRDANDDHRLLGAEAEAYIEAGRASGPKNARLATVDELNAVLGMTPALVRRLHGLLTVHALGPGVDRELAEPSVRDALDALIDNSRSLLTRVTLLQPSSRQLFLVKAETVADGARRLERAWVLRFGADALEGPALLAVSERQSEAMRPPVADAPSCLDDQAALMRMTQPSRVDASG